MPVTVRVISRPGSKIPFVAIPLAMMISFLLAWSADRMTEVPPVFAVSLAVVSALLATQIVIDLQVRRLLRELSWSGFAIFTATALTTSPGTAAGLTGLFAGAAMMAGIAALLVIVSRGALGLGDLHLAPLLGAMVGWFSPGGVILAWMITAIAGALFATIGLASGRLRRGSMIAYGPFMVLGSVATVAVIAIRR